MPLAKWRTAVVWMGWTSWEPWKSIYGRRYAKITKKKKNKRERRKGSKMACGGKMNSRAGIYRAQNIRRDEGLYTLVKSVYAAA